MKLTGALILLLVSANAFADDCVVGSFAVVGNAIKVCEFFINSGSYSGNPNNAQFLEFLKAHRDDPQLSDLMTKSVGVSTPEAIDYFKGEIDGKHYTTAVTADSDTDSLRKVADRLNDHFKYTDEIAALKAKQKATREEYNSREPLNGGLKALDAMAQSNTASLNKLSAECRNTRAEEPLSAIEVHFADNGDRQANLPVSVTRVDGNPNTLSVTFVSDAGLETRVIKQSDGKIYYTGKDGMDYEVTLEKVSANKIGGIRNFGDNRSNGCYLSALSRQTPKGQASRPAALAPATVAQ